jgi:preprotein translocase subunit SecB
VPALRAPTSPLNQVLSTGYFSFTRIRQVRAHSQSGHKCPWLTHPPLRSILEQLIHSRAFLSFALVVVALIARLHALTASLFEDLAKTSTVLVRLAHANSVSFPCAPAIPPFTRSLTRSLVSLSSSPPLKNPSNSCPQSSAASSPSNSPRTSLPPTSNPPASIPRN